MKKIHEENITHLEYTYTVHFDPSPEGGYTVTCPALPGLATEGDTLEEARSMARDAIRCYLESLQKEGASLPEDEDEEEPLREKIKVELTRI